MGTIRSWSLIKTHNRNFYFYDRQKKRTQLCHPLLFYILTLSYRGIDAGEHLAGLTKGKEFAEIENVGRFSKQDIDYYYQKYLLLKQNGYFGQIDQKETLKAQLNAEMVKKSIANTKQVVFEVTDRCNLSCEYCGYGKFYHDYDERENKDLDIRTAKQLLDNLLELWNSPLNISHDKNIYISFYGGEPTMNIPVITEIVRYVKQLDAHRNRFSFSITTNGTLLHKHMDFLVENKFNLFISLDGCEQNNAYRVFNNGNPTYKTIMANVDALRSKYPDYFLKHVRFNAVIHNKNSVADVYRFFKERFDKTPTLLELNSSGIKESHVEEFWRTYANVTESLYNSENYSAIEKDMFVTLPNVQGALLFLHRYNNFCFEDYNDFVFRDEGETKLPTGTCLPFSKKIYVTVNGKILPCERIGQQFGMGSVSPDSMNLNYEKIAVRYNLYYRKMLKQCSVCHNTDACKQCIFNLETIDDKRPVCHGFMTDSENSRYLSSFLYNFENKPEIYSRILKEVVVE